MEAARVDPFKQIDYWIRTTQLAGGVISPEDVAASQESVRQICARIRPGAQEAGQPFFDMGARILWAYMAARATQRDSSSEAQEVIPRKDFKRVLEDLARSQPPGPIKDELERSAAFADRTLASAMTTVGM